MGIHNRQRRHEEEVREALKPKENATPMDELQRMFLTLVAQYKEMGNQLMQLGACIGAVRAQLNPPPVDGPQNGRQVILPDGTTGIAVNKGSVPNAR